MPSPHLHEGLEEPCPRGMAQPNQRLFLDLPNPLPSDTEDGSDLLECHRLLIVQPEVQPQDLRFAFLERTQRFLDGILERVGVRLVLGTGRVLVREIIEQTIVFPQASWGHPATGVTARSRASARLHPA